MSHRLRALLSCLLAAGVLLATLGVAAPAALAASNGLWSVFPTAPPGRTPPAFLRPTLKPGTATFGSVTIDNYTASPLTLDLYAADAFNTATGGLSLRRQIDPQHGIGRWLHLFQSQVTVRARQSVDVPFVITTPANAPPGDHVGGVVAEQTKGTPAKAGSLPITVLEAVAVRVYARVRGTLSPALSVSHVALTVRRPFASQFGGSVRGQMAFTVRNSGNTVLTPRVRVDFSTPFGDAGRARTVSPPSLLPGSSVRSTVPVAGVPALGNLRAQVSVAGGGAHARATVDAGTVPWGLVAVVGVVVLAVLLLAVLWWRRRRRRRRPVPETPGAGAEPAEADASSSSS